MSIFQNNQYQAVRKIIENPDKTNFDALKNIGIKQGFQNTKVRKIVWPLLLGMKPQDLCNEVEYTSNENESLYSKTIQIDSTRSLAHLDYFKESSEKVVQSSQKNLFDILETLMLSDKNLQYYQGYNDVASLFMILFGKDAGYNISKQAACTFFRDYFMLPLEQTVDMQLKFIMQIIKNEDQQFATLLTEGIFGVSWILTWFSHSSSNLFVQARIFDFLLSSGPKAIMYLITGLILSTKSDLKKSVEGLNKEDQTLYIFNFYLNIKKQTLNWEQIFQQAMNLQEMYKFEDIMKQADISFPENSIIQEKNFEELLPHNKNE